MIDMKFTLHYFAKEDNWRVYDASGDYSTAKTTYDIPTTIKALLREISARTAKMGEENVDAKR